MTVGTTEQSLQFVLNSFDFVELKAAADLIVDLRYATDNNFAGRNLYGPFNRAFLHKLSHGKLENARRGLQRRQPGYKFIVFDALRPGSVQKAIWKMVAGTPGEKYFANPDFGSLHSFGFAIDLSLCDDQGRELDMGAGFDDFRPIAQPQFEERFFKEGQLNELHLRHRRLLRETMEEAGFIQLPNEWWHFDALPKKEVRANYSIID